MNELYQMQVDAVRELVTQFLGQVSEMSLSKGVKPKIKQMIDELEIILAEDTPDLEAVKDSVVSIRDVIDGARQIRLY